MVRLSFAFDAIFFLTMEKQFSSNGIFWRVIIKNENGEILFFKENEDEPYYYFSHEDYKLNFEHWYNHLIQKTWFTNEMFIFITAQILRS
jgi:hypothetical protein